jgi:hypothetical protein
MNELKKTTNKELDKAITQVDKFDESVKEMTLDRMNQAPKEEVEPQTKLSQKQIEKSRDLYLKPERAISSREKFNEDYRKDYNFDMEYVQFIAENKELIGETIEIWTKPYAGMPAEYWKVPCNKPVWGPRHLAEQIKRARYHRLKMDEKIITSADSSTTMYGAMAVDTTVQRLDAQPVSSKKSVFMGANNF